MGEEHFLYLSTKVKLTLEYLPVDSNSIDYSAKSALRQVLNEIKTDFNLKLKNCDLIDIQVW